MLASVGLAAELAERAKAKGPITVGLAGAGQMGTDIVVQVGQMPGMRIGAISEIRMQNAIDAAVMAGRARGDVVEASSAQDIDRAIEGNRVAVTGDYKALCAAGHIDVIIDATGNPNIGTLVALEAMKHGKHVVMLNVEADITIGRFLREEADKAGVVFTGAAGDEPACTLELISFAQSCGFEIVAAGKGKNNALKFDAMPEDYEAEAARRNMSPRMLVEFVDGSKTMIEMTAIANATGLVPDVPGMHGPSATREELAQVLCTKADGGILSKPGVVDYSIGKGVAPGVFCIVKPRHDAGDRADDRPQGRPRPVFFAAAALSPDEPGSAAVGGARGGAPARRHGAARPSGGRMRDGGQARSRPRADARGDRPARLPRLRHDLGGRPHRRRDAARARREGQGGEADQGGREADLRELRAGRLDGGDADPQAPRPGRQPVRDDEWRSARDHAGAVGSGRPPSPLAGEGGRAAGARRMRGRGTLRIEHDRRHPASAGRDPVTASPLAEAPSPARGEGRARAATGFRDGDWSPGGTLNFWS